VYLAMGCRRFHGELRDDPGRGEAAHPHAPRGPRAAPPLPPGRPALNLIGLCCEVMLVKRQRVSEANAPHAPNTLSGPRRPLQRVMLVKRQRVSDPTRHAPATPLLWPIDSCTPGPRPRYLHLLPLVLSATLDPPDGLQGARLVTLVSLFCPSVPSSCASLWYGVPWGGGWRVVGEAEGPDGFIGDSEPRDGGEPGGEREDAGHRGDAADATAGARAGAMMAASTHRWSGEATALLPAAPQGRAHAPPRPQAAGHRRLAAGAPR